MKPWQKWSFHSLTLIVSASGLLYLWMKDFLPSDDPFSVINHPLQPWMLNAHLLAAPLLLFVMGVIWSSHVSKKVGRRLPNRRTGWVALLSFPAMTLSGYLLPMLSEPAWRQATLVIHLASGILFAVFYGAHIVVSIRLLRQNDDAGPYFERTAASSNEG